MAIYLDYEGVKGSVGGDYKDHVEVSSVEFGVSRPISMKTGNMANREVGKPNISEVNLTKEADSSVSGFFKEAVSGSTGKKVAIKFARTSGDKLQEFMEYTLYDCLVSNYNISAIGEQVPIENITLSFSKCEINYISYDGTNKSGSPQRAGYDLAQAKAI